MGNLSAAAAVMIAYWKGQEASQQLGVAAALRAAVDQVVPPALEEEFYDRNQALPLTSMVEIRQRFIALADELEDQS